MDPAIIALLLFVGAAGAQGDAEPKSQVRVVEHDGEADRVRDRDERLIRLRDQLGHADVELRRNAILELVELGDDHAAEALAGAALFDTHPTVRREAVDGLGEIGQQAIGQFLTFVLFDPDPAVREAAIDAIVDVGGPEAAWSLNFALGDEEISIREQAVYALGVLGGKPAIMLLELARADDAPTVREAAARELTRLARRRGLP